MSSFLLHWKLFSDLISDWTCVLSWHHKHSEPHQWCQGTYTALLIFLTWFLSDKWSAWLDLRCRILLTKSSEWECLTYLRNSWLQSFLDMELPLLRVMTIFLLQKTWVEGHIEETFPTGKWKDMIICKKEKRSLMNHSQYPRILNSLASGSSLARANGSKALGMANSGFEGQSVVWWVSQSSSWRWFFGYNNKQTCWSYHSTNSNNPVGPPMQRCWFILAPWHVKCSCKVFSQAATRLESCNLRLWVMVALTMY